MNTVQSHRNPTGTPKIRAIINANFLPAFMNIWLLYSFVQLAFVFVYIF